MLLVILSYLFGSIPFGLILTKKFLKLDIREFGSKNIGATNVLRTGNKKIALITLLLDFCKGLIPLLIAIFLNINNPIIIGFAAFFGHIFPIWIKFKGGKGVATYIGIITIISPIVSLLFILIWIIVFLIFRYSSLSSTICATITPIIYIGVYYFSINSLIINKLFSFYQDNFFINLIFILFMSTILLYRHSENIKRLLNGQEAKIK
ncbi:MAG: glycerol-3-phosphate 1-O-acyltransferase PlsY [Hyphomicrobiales bacterium]|nr:glycerol-3-phosphate 1-O-acyltransferase PlsY [Hyphomicrobiales bacterium]|tara:strand:+ start:525 stop:1145 length:621 start_codon:yes stop_codon:yes gene_type:complete